MFCKYRVQIWRSLRCVAFLETSLYYALFVVKFFQPVACSSWRSFWTLFFFSFSLVFLYEWCLVEFLIRFSSCLCLLSSFIYALANLFCLIMAISVGSLLNNFECFFSIYHPVCCLYISLSVFSLPRLIFYTTSLCLSTHALLAYFTLIFQIFELFYTGCISFNFDNFGSSLYTWF